MKGIVWLLISIVMFYLLTFRVIFVAVFSSLVFHIPTMCWQSDNNTHKAELTDRKSVV